MKCRVSRWPDRKARALRPTVVELEDRLVPTTFTVTQFSDGTSLGTLRWAINQADQTPGQDTVVLRPGVYTLTQSGPETTGGQTGCASGRGQRHDQGRGAGKTHIVAAGLDDHVFHVAGGIVKFSGLTISGGEAVQGGGILIDSGNVTIANCVLTANDAEGIAGSAGQGGALYQASGSLNVTNTTVSGNLALGAAAMSSSPLAGGAGEGGGFYLDLGVSAALNRVRFANNAAQGGQSSTATSSQGGYAAGGAIKGTGITLTIAQSTFTGNRAIGGIGLDASSALTGGDAYGGAISVQTASTLTLHSTAVSTNQAAGGDGGTGATGGDGGRGGRRRGLRCLRQHADEHR